jgi:hypothetical protein
MQVKATQSVPPCYCITGHGRSGTSFVAAMLQSAGLDIGRRLMEPGEANVRGHFEDMDFHDFHVDVLRSQGFGVEGFVLQPSIRVQEQFLADARALVDRRREAGRPWGWKEPRSTLFLDFWRERVPELKFLLLFRTPWDVVDSLFRRGDEIYLRNPNFAVQVWQNYNRAVIDFHDRFPERCLLIESHAVAYDPGRLTEAIARKFGDTFGVIGDVYEDDLFRHATSAQQRSVLAHFFPEVLTQYEALRSRAAVVLETEAVASSPAVFDWALQHWIDFRRTESREKGTVRYYQGQLEDAQRQVHEAQADRERLTAEIGQAHAVTALLQEEQDQTRAALDETRTTLEQTRTALEQTRAALDQTRTALERTQGEAERSRGALERTEAERHELRAELGRNEAERALLEQISDRTRAHLVLIEASRFSKLRRFWHRVRSPSRFRPDVDPADGPRPDPSAKPRGIFLRRGDRARNGQSHDPSGQVRR